MLFAIRATQLNLRKNRKTYGRHSMLLSRDVFHIRYFCYYHSHDGGKGRLSGIDMFKSTARTVEAGGGWDFQTQSIR